MSEITAAGSLERLAAETKVDFPGLQKARDDTADHLDDLRHRIASIDHDDDVCVILCGSSARQELTDQSDDDWLILAADGDRPSLKPTDDDVRGLIDEGKEPGRQGIFGAHAYCDDLAGKIGLDPDDNKNLTRRVLTILESVPLLNDAAYEGCWKRILDGYLAESTRGQRPPRFFLNDVVRYWRTICVDFVGKQRSDEIKWGTRNAKLRTSRKILFAAGLLPLLQCFQFDQRDTRAFLVEQLKAPATDRLAYAFKIWGIPDAGARFLQSYDRWVAMSGEPSVREALDSIGRPEDARDSEVFEEVREIAKDLDLGLLTLLFETALEPISRQYGIF